MLPLFMDANSVAADSARINGTVRKIKTLTGFDGSYYIVRVDVSKIIADADNDLTELCGETLSSLLAFLHEIDVRFLIVDPLDGLVIEAQVLLVTTQRQTEVVKGLAHVGARLLLGRLGPEAEGQALACDGAIPTNTSGGQLSEGHVEGMLQVVEGVRVRTYPEPPASTGHLSYVREFLVCWLWTAWLTVRVERREGFDVLQACNPPDTFWLLARLWRLRGKRFVYDQHDLCPEVFQARFGQIHE